MQKPKYHVFVCSSSKINGQQKGYCFSKDGVGIVQAFLEEIEARDLTSEVMVTNTGCLGICTSGPNVVVYPEGVWYKEVTVDDVSEIVESHFENGEIVERLEIK
ncbi:thioredoxin-like 2Fe-2S ferredoxin (nif operon-associated) [Candidatus Desulfosporosinus infrequens]|uniref:Thioredoxin-like 2Fe-2S ferredoxin (Nif operon-associated) n=1 Tax=Candidatus Desulfosporosinus infrequens TaxID=2043169 RepID=A0A2U3L2N3_9FIRM|nr:thioredoxin-like 2Fe-2S ferredoxin (nif operon-associated) [Candidatus Desulfosporosinus infrequens]